MSGDIYIQPWFIDAEKQAGEVLELLSEMAGYYNHNGHTLDGFVWPTPRKQNFLRLLAALRCWPTNDFSLPAAFRFQGGTWLYVREAGTGWYRVDGGYVPKIEEMDTPAIAPNAAGAEVPAAVVPAGWKFRHRLNAFSKAGDSLTASPLCLTQVARAVVGPYNVKPALDFYSGSFERSSRAAQFGWSVADTLGAIDAELAEWRPSLALISIGTNDAGARTTQQFKDGLAALCNKCISFGTLPVLQTLPRRADADTAPNSQAVREVAEALGCGLIDQRAAMEGLERNGLDLGGVHSSAPASGNAMDFTDLRSGYTTRNLRMAGLLEQVRRAL